MIKSVRYINNDTYLIPSIINEVSLLYSNFSHFEIIEDKQCKRHYDMVLYFHDKKSVCDEPKDTLLKCTMLKSIWHEEIDEVLKNQFLNFDGYIKSYMFENHYNKNNFDLLMVHDISREHFSKVPATIRKSHTGFRGKNFGVKTCGYKLRPYHGESIASYSYSDKLLFDWELEITSSKNFIVFSQRFNRDENITWFTLSYNDSESGNILIKTYKNEHKSIYNTERVIDCENSISINDLDNILAKFINSMQDKYNIMLSKDSKNEFTKAILSDVKKYLLEK